MYTEHCKSVRTLYSSLKIESHAGEILGGTKYAKTAWRGRAYQFEENFVRKKKRNCTVVGVKKGGIHEIFQSSESCVRFKPYTD